MHTRTIILSQNMQARDDTANGNVNEARRTLKACPLWCIGACAWVFYATAEIISITIIALIVYSVTRD